MTSKPPEPRGGGSISDDPARARSSGAAEGAERLTAILVLLFCCVLWGWSFPTMQFASRAFEAQSVTETGSGPLASLGVRALMNGVRFGIAGLLIVLISWKHQRRFTRSESVGGAVVGLFFTAGMLLQVLGLAWARPSVSSFLTSLTVVFAPLAQAAILRRVVGGAVWAAVILALAGVLLLAWPNPEAAQGGLTTSPPVPLLGEALTILGSLVFTAQLLAIDHYGQSANPWRLTSVMLLTAGVLSLAIAAGLSGGHLLLPSLAFRLAVDPTVWWSLGSLILFSSVLAIPLMNAYQPKISPAMASVVYCSEPLFGVLFSVLLGAERLTGLTVAGGFGVLLAVLAVGIRGRRGNGARTKPAR